MKLCNSRAKRLGLVLVVALSLSAAALGFSAAFGTRCDHCGSSSDVRKAEVCWKCDRGDKRCDNCGSSSDVRTSEVCWKHDRGDKRCDECGSSSDIRRAEVCWKHDRG